MKTRRFTIVVPETTHIYEVDMDSFTSFAKECDNPADDGFLFYKLEDDIYATLEIGKFGDADYGFRYESGIITGFDEVVVRELDPIEPPEREEYHCEVCETALMLRGDELDMPDRQVCTTEGGTVLCPECFGYYMEGSES